MNWYKKIWRPRKMGILFIHFSGDDTQYTTITINRRKRVTKEFNTIEEAIKGTGKNLPYHIHVSGTGVLSRKVEFLPTFKDELIISGNQNEFIFTAFNDNFEVATSFFRKELICEVLEHCATEKTHVLGISSGSVPAFNLLDDGKIELDYLMAIEDYRITKFERLSAQKESILWEGERYSSFDLIAMSIHHSYWNDEERYEHHLLTNARENYSQFAQFKTYGIGVLLIIFLSLLGNYFYQNKLNNDIAQLELDLSLSNDNLSLLDRLDQEKERKEQLIGSAGITSSRFLANYLDEIGKTVPSAIQLQELKLFPLSKKLKNKQKVEVSKDQIVVIGTTKGNVILDDWIEKMDRFEWIKSIELLNYLKNEQSQAEFKLLINLGS